MSFLSQVFDYVCDCYGVTKDEVSSDKRSRRVVIPRQEIMFMLLEGGWTATQAAVGAGRKDHTTALHARKAVPKRSPERARQLERVVKEIREGIDPDAHVQEIKLADRVATLSGRLKKARELLVEARAEISVLKGGHADTTRLMLRADRAYGVGQLYDRIEQLEAELRHEREVRTPNPAYNRYQDRPAAA